MNVFRRQVMAAMVLFSLGSAIMAAGGYVDKILFSTLDNYNRTQIYAVNPDGSGLSQITNEPGMGASNPCVSPDGTKIVFTSAMTYGSSALKMMNSDGSHLTNIYPGNGFSGVLLTRPRFSKNGRSLYVMKLENGDKVMMEINLTTKGITRKGNLKSSAVQTISNGDIVYSTGLYNAFPDIYRCKSDATSSKLIVKDACSPDISPDGRIIAFHRSEKYTNIFTIDDKGEEKRLTDNMYCNYDPAFSPNGTKIAFCSYGVGVNPGSDIKICVMYKEGIGLHDLVTGFNNRVNGTVWATLSANPKSITPDFPWDKDWELIINPPKPDIYASENKNTAEIGYNQFTDSQLIAGFAKSRRINTYYVKVKNSGDIAVPFIIKGVATGLNGWTLKMMDENNTIVNFAILSSKGLTTPTIAAGKTFNFRLEASPASSIKNDEVIDVVLTAYSSIDETVNDKITVRTTKE